MGIVGLWPLLEPTCQPVPLEALEGMILAVGELLNVSIWIYQAQLGYPGEAVELSDEDDVVSMESRPFFPDTNRSSAIDFLIEERERIRADRLKPSQKSTSDDSDDGEFYSKTTMIEDHAKRSMGHRNAVTVMLRSDDWSSDSGTEDFIDVPSIDLPFDHSLNLIETKQQSVKEGEDFEWSNKEDLRNGASGGRDSECYKDLQDFLTACGFPWIEAPGEAEAQCVQLEKLGLVQVAYYSQFVSLGLSQSEFVGIAVISGSDYSSGLTGIGVVTAIELLSEFAVTKSSVQSDSQEYETMRTLKNIGEWMVTFESNVELPEPISIRQKLRSVIMKNNDVDKIKSIVNDEVVAAYFHPNVDNSTEKFRWRRSSSNIAALSTESRKQKCPKEKQLTTKHAKQLRTGSAPQNLQLSEESDLNDE
ncbi:unnamed protein product [Angiostrongylus costaricensis]|uniref:XPGI domain-containing protein n=1 Tax=Angiostrongylus costaricensis TaxID=334426 RepID=A0A158PKN4_ANGCS|nr:unnamed protein product [Angiostrongylus costaricensis]